MKKLLYIVNVDWFFVSHRLPIALSAIEVGYDVHIACNVTDKQALLTSHGITVHPISLSRSGTGLFGELKTLLQLMLILYNLKPDIVHNVTIKPVLYGNLAARLLRVPTRISSISGLGYVFIDSSIKAKLLQLIISRAYKTALKGSKSIIFQNTSDRDLLKNLGAITPHQEVFTRGSGIDLNAYPVTPEHRSTPVIMLAARLLIDKGVEEFTQAALMLKNTPRKIRMVLVGKIEPENPNAISKAQVKKWTSSGLVEYWGYSDDIASTMAKANIIVLPSYREGLPKTLIEAAACGRAVITTDVPGCRDAIEANKTGLLIPAHSASLLADAIITLIDNRELRAEFADNGRRLAESAFDISDVINTHLAIYKD